MKILLVINDAPYGIERTYNALRLAGALSGRDGTELRIFLLGDAVTAAKRGQKVPAGYYNAEAMLAKATKRGAVAAVCGTCMDARGIPEDHLAEGSRRGALAELADWTAWADKIITF